MDVVGIGAINVDYIKPMGRFSRKPYKGFKDDFEPNTESFVKDNELEAMLETIGLNYKRTGGSAFNTIRCLAQLECNLHLGYVGVSGVYEGKNIRGEVAKHGIDTEFVFESQRQAGKCISVYWKSKKSRSLKTAPGANDDFASKLIDDAIRQRLIQYLAQARWIHLTSFIDRAAFEKVVEIVIEAKRHNPLLTVSFDPGSVFCKEATEPVKNAVRVSDYVFLNERELFDLSMIEGSLQEELIPSMLEAADRVFERCGSSNALLVLKSYRCTRFFQRFKNETIARTRWKPIWSPISIADDTGAGDIFAAGFIAAQLLPIFSFDMKSAIILSSNLVTTKLKTIGCDAGLDYGLAFRRTLAEIRLSEKFNWKDLGSVFLSNLKGVILGLLLAVVAGLLVFAITSLFH